MRRHGNRYRTTGIIIVIMVAIGLVPAGALCQRIYSWTDKDGTLHITNEPPTESADSVNVYRVNPTPQPPEATSPKKDRKAVEAIQDYERLKEEKATAEDQAVKARKKAIEARRRANDAKAEADRVKAETKELEKKTTRRAAHRLELQRQKDHEMKTIEIAQKAVSLAQEAESLARLAEAEAERLRQLTLTPPK